MASINRHAIEISNNTRTQPYSTLSSLSLRGGPPNLPAEAFLVKSLRCDPHRDPPWREPTALVSPGFSGWTAVRPSFPLCWARGRTLRVWPGVVKPEGPFPKWPRTHGPKWVFTWPLARPGFVRGKGFQRALGRRAENREARLPSPSERWPRSLLLPGRLPEA